MNKFLSAAAIFVTLTTSAAADPLSDFFDGAFGGQQPQQKVTRGKHGRNIQSDDTNDWTASWGNHGNGGSHMVASFYGHGERLSRHTASGAVFNPHGYSAAHRTFPFGTHLRVCHLGALQSLLMIEVHSFEVVALIFLMVLLGLLVWDRHRP